MTAPITIKVKVAANERFESLESLHMPATLPIVTRSHDAASPSRAPPNIAELIESSMPFRKGSGKMRNLR